ncbi:MAG TPA: biotin--[acetyl-CoA-carboxylase] ligase [Nitrospinota bacterium]|jgi:BirA family biotin operon repressor/biotin-[acetyl-CoA-carboxylase] ligase|nr:biotin--[acetyl-CoA-carboxylase] ligase [Nitrospinota bacterium]
MTGLSEAVRRHRRKGREAPIHCFTSIDSTNAEAHRLLENGSTPEGTAVLADAQTAGRGRGDRSWFSPPGAGLYLSVIFHPNGADAPHFTLAAGVAAATALEQVAGRAPTLKWPNDLAYDGRKVGGILTEARAVSEQIQTVVVGIGVNLLQRPEDFPGGLRPAATSVAAATGRWVGKAELAARILDELDAGHRLLGRDGFAPVAEAWKQRSSTLGKRVRVMRGDVPVEGVAKDLAADGSLVIETLAGSVRVHAGEVKEIGRTECFL